MRIFVALLTRLLLPAAFSLTVGQLIGQGPLTLISGSTRLLQMVLALVIVLTVLRGRHSPRLLLVMLLLTADQARVVSESLLTTFSPDL